MTDLAAAYRDKSPSFETKAALAALHFGIVLLAFWLLFGGGIGLVDGLLGREPLMASTARRCTLAGAALLYFVRTLFTMFVFVRRRMPWPEVMTIAIWILVIEMLFAYFGGKNGESFQATGIIGIVLVISGSFLNTGSEWQRHVWKRRPGHQGHLLTSGFFQYAQHINYFGDMVLFTGWVLLTGRPALLSIPALMFCGFVFVNIPAQDRYLEERYGEEYRLYAKRTARLIPYIY
jgi:protein-S-isoprenylcysteine O-methyltransferase Ste14